MPYVVDRQALKRAGFPKAPVYCGWYEKPNPRGAKPAKVKDVHGKPGSLDWRFPREVKPHPEQGDMLGINIYDSFLTCADIDERHPIFKTLVRATRCAEISFSSRGIHCFSRCRLAADAPQHWHKDGHTVELYGANSPGRFIALTGRFLPGKECLEDVLDEPVDFVAVLTADGWAPAAATATADVVIPADLPPPPVLGQLDEWAAVLDARDRDDPERGNGPWGRMGAGKQSRWAVMHVLMCRAAALVRDEAQLAAWWYDAFPKLIGARQGDHRADCAREVGKAWASRPEAPGDVSRETLAADFGDALAPDAADRVGGEEQEENDGDGGDPDIGGIDGQGGGPGQLSIPDEELARDMMAHLEGGQSGVMWAPGMARAYFLQPHSGLWLPDMDGRQEREIYTYSRGRVEQWLAAADPRPAPGMIRKAREDFGGTGRMARVRTAVQAYGGISHEKLDENPLLVGMVDGVYDVEADRFRMARMDEHVTMTTAVPPDPKMDIPVFRGFLSSIFAHDPELIGFMQRWIGYTLTGLTTEQKIVFGWGKGSNGKTTFFELIKDLLGTYAKKVSAGMLMERRQEQHATEIAQLIGKRFVLATEVPEIASWNENRLKELSGGDTINANFMRQDKIEFRMDGKITIAGNHKPRMNGNDYALIRRFCLVAFLQQFEGKQVDGTLPARMREEMRGILWWAVQGCRDWRRNGLQIPQSVIAASADYFKQEDMISEWLKNNCEMGPDFKLLIRDATRSINHFLAGIGRTRLYSPRQLREELEAKGYTLQEGQGHMQQLMGFRLMPDNGPGVTVIRTEPDYGGDV